MNFTDALRIAYPRMADPVIADLARYERDIERKEAEQEEIDIIVTEYKETLAGRNSLRDDAKVDAALDNFLACLLNAKTELSVQRAMTELSIALQLAATHLAVAEFHANQRAAAESADVEAYERSREIREVA